MSRIQLVFSYVLAYLLWLVSIILGVLALYFVREAYLLAIVFSASNPNGRSQSEMFDFAMQARAADQLSLFVLGMLMIVLIVFLEHYYRTAVPTGSLWSRFSLITAISIGVLCLANAVYFFIEGQIRPVFGKVIYVLTFEVLLVCLFMWLWFYFRRKRASAV